ncbi:MAG: rhodanese-like domain-containing protein, partial [Vicinamibacterales bacterium]
MITHLSPQDALAPVERGETLVLDVRSPGEYARLGHIPGS